MAATLAGATATSQNILRVSLTDCYENGATRRGNGANRPDNQCHLAKKQCQPFLALLSRGARQQTRTRPGSFAAIGFDESLAKVLADEALNCGYRILGETDTSIVSLKFPFCGNLADLLFRRLFRNYHGPERLVGSLIVAGDGQADVRRT